MEDGEENLQQHHMTNVFSAIKSAGPEGCLIKGGRRWCPLKTVWETILEGPIKKLKVAAVQGESDVNQTNKWTEDWRTKRAHWQKNETTLTWNISFITSQRRRWFAERVLMKIGGRMRNVLRRDTFHYDAHQDELPTWWESHQKLFGVEHLDQSCGHEDWRVLGWTNQPSHWWTTRSTGWAP